MTQEKDYVLVLKKYVEKSGQTAVSQEEIDAFQELLTVQISEYLQSYLDKDYEGLSLQLTRQRKLRKSFTKILKECRQVSVLAGQFVQTFNIFNKLLQNQNNRSSFSEEMQTILRAHKRSKEVLLFLYHHPHAQHNEIVDNTNIPKSSLSDLLRVLEKVQCVMRVAAGKYSFFDLTVEGRTFVEDLQPDIKEERPFDIIRGYDKEIKWIADKEKMIRKAAPRKYTLDMTKSSSLFIEHSGITDDIAGEMNRRIWPWVQRSEKNQKYNDAASFRIGVVK